MMIPTVDSTGVPQHSLRCLFQIGACWRRAIGAASAVEELRKTQVHGRRAVVAMVDPEEAGG
jgi:hypothetical protein